jgi:uncharacterized zinc-type alcohol dehydrogenase-like protein
MIIAKGYAAKSKGAHLHEIEFERRMAGPGDVAIDILYCGVCHSDVHQVDNDWGNSVYPCLPGHEIVGRVTEVGSDVSAFKPGDVVGVGCMVDSCLACEPCRDGEEQYCEGPKGWTATYNGPQKPDGTNTYGGYSDHIVVRQEFVVRVPDSIEISQAGPILCAGVTTYSPMKHWGVKADDKVAIVGLGGLGHMAVKLAKALGARVTVITHDLKDKADDAKRLGVDVIDSTDKAQLAQYELTFDFILSTIPEKHDVNPYVKLLKRNGKLVIVGLLGPEEKPLDNQEVAFHRRTVAGSLIGGIAETQEVLDFCAEHGIAPDVELIGIEGVNDAFTTLRKGDTAKRFVIDMASLKAA